MAKITCCICKKEYERTLSFKVRVRKLGENDDHGFPKELIISNKHICSQCLDKIKTDFPDLF